MTADRDHLDAETIAAWMDGGLDAVSLAAAEAHASTCARCQGVLAAVAKTTPAVVVEKRPFRIPAWWYPLAAGAAAVVIWMVVPQQRDIATAPTQPPAAVREAPADKPQGVSPQEEKAASLQDKKPAAPKETAAAPRDQFAELRKDRSQPPARSQDADTAKLKADKVEAPGARNEMQAAAAAPAEPAAMLQRARVVPTEVVSPDGSRRWRFADYASEVTVGAAVSSSVCWLAGRAGLVMLTTNGTTFDHVDLPERVDAVAITAVDARAATVTTADGRTFQTSDGGRTWRLIQA